MADLNILMLTLDYPPYTYGGIATHVYNLCEEFKKYNCYVKVIVARLGRYIDELPSVTNEKNISVVRIDTKKLNYGEVINDVYEYNEFSFSYYNIMLFKEITKIIDEDNIKYDILHIHHGAKFAFVYSALRAKYGFRTIMTMHAMNSDHREYIHGLRCWCLVNSNAVIAVSNYIKDEITKRHLNYPKNIFIIYNGIKQDVYDNEKSYDISFCGRLSKVKGCECLIEALKIVYAKVGLNNIKTIIVGDGELKEKMQQELDDYKSIKFIGNVKNEEVLNILSKTKINVIPSQIEAFGIVALESMCSSSITIASNQGGLPEIIRNGYNGFLFEKNNPQDLAEKIIYVLDKYDDLRYIIENGKKTIREFSWERVAKQTYEVYEKVMQMNKIELC